MIPTGRDGWWVLSWAMVAAWLILIWHFGKSQVFGITSSDEADRWALRKGIHVVVYGVLGGLLTWGLGPQGRRAPVAALCLLVALGDELHQGLVPGRAFRVRDLAIDLVGGTLGAAFVAGAGAWTGLWRRDSLK